MSKKFLRTALTVVAIGLNFVPGLGAVAALGIKIGVGALIGLGLGVASALLLKPKAPRVSPNATERLTASFDPNAPRKIAFGHTALATDVRYQTFTSDQTYYHQILCVASHTVEAIDEIWFDSEMAWSAGGGVVSKYTGYLDVTVRNPGTNVNGIAIDSVWTSTATLTGCAYLHLRFKLTGNDKKAESPFGQSIPTRVTVRGKGAFLPDVREVGVDAEDQATWDWFDDDSGRNPALQLLFYLLGWKINGVLAVGRGIPADRIDLDSFTTAANFCDEPVSLAAGGTEPRYRSDGLFSEGDPPNLVIGNLCDAMNAVIRDNGGQLALHVLHNDLATPVAAFTAADILGDDEWVQTVALDETFNVVRGQYVDPSDASLYQMVDYPEVSLSSVDGIERIDTFPLPLVQSAPQAQRLAKQRLERNLYRGSFSATFSYRAWQVNLGDPVTLSHVALGWTDKLFRVVAHSISLDGTVKMTLREENAAIYAWDADESAAVTPAAATAYNPLLNPLLGAINDGIRERGTYAGGTTYSLNDVSDDQNVKWLYINATPGSGHAPPTLPATSNSYWRLWDTRLAFSSEMYAPRGTTVPIVYSFDASAEGWTATGATATVSGGLVSLASSGTDPIFRSAAGLSIAGGTYKKVRARFRSLTAGAAWDGKVFYTTGGHGESASFYKSIPASPGWASGDWCIGEWDMAALTVGGSDWTSNTITRLRLDLAAQAVTVEIDWIALCDEFAAPVLVSGVEDSADVTSLIDGDKTITIEADYLGTIVSGELTKDVAYRLFRNGVQVTSGVTWSRTVISGSSTTSITGTGTGTLSISAFTSETKLRITAVYGSTTRTFDVTIQLHQAGEPVSGGSGSTSASTTTISSTSSSSYGSANAGPLTIECPSSGIINYSLAGFFKRTTSSAGTSGAHGKVQWRIVGGVFADVTTETASQADAETINEPPVQQSRGTLNIPGGGAAGQKSGLTPGSQYEFQLLLRSDAAVTLNFTGTFEVHQ